MNTVRRFQNGKLIEFTIDGIAQPISNLGDKIAGVAQPIARAIDRIAKTKISTCGGCKKMKERLNAGMPFAQALKLRIKGE
jgi:hypothetical protein